MAHISETDLAKSLREATALIPVDSTFAHYRTPGHTYTIVGHAILEADGSVGIIYKANYGEEITFVRSLASWQEQVEHNGKLVPRFSAVD